MKRLESLFPGLDKEFLDLLKGMLEFNPYYRITAARAVKSKIFDKIRVPSCEQNCPIKIN